MMAKGKSSINRADLDERGQGMFDRYAGGAGITNGVMTRDQFTQAMSAAGGGRGGNRGGGNRGGGGDNPGNAWGGGGWNAPAVDPMESIALAAFRKMDLNGDGVLNYDEMSESLKAEKDKWDTDKNGFIDFNEFKAYLQARMQAVVGDGSEIAGGADPDLDKTEDDKKPIVYRAGKLPKELPSWFAELDTDHDAQVGLYEWKKSGRSLEEFAAMDRNGDGFLTVEEVLHAGRSGVEGASGGRMVAAMGDPGAGDGGVMTMQRNYPPSDSGGARPGGRRPGGPGGNKTRGDNPKGRGGNKDGGGGRNKKGGGGGGGNRGGFDPNDDI
jgi:Ca2+-binding EF-hand superfamily protein